MRGADGLGWSGAPRGFRPHYPNDPRSAAPGALSAMRAMNDIAATYGPWLASLRRVDPLVIPVSSRMLRLEHGWQGLGGFYFTRLYEAYNACLAAHRPARFVFVDDLADPPAIPAGTGAVLLVSQIVEPEPRLAEWLRAFRAANVPVFCDETCRPELVRDLRPAGVKFDRVERDPHVWQDDSAYVRLPRIFREHAARLRESLGDVPPVAECSDPDVLLTEYTDGRARYLLVVNDKYLPFDPGLMWRVGLTISHRTPLFAQLKLPPHDYVYDVFEQRVVREEGSTSFVDLRCMPWRLLAIVPWPLRTMRFEGATVKSATAGDRIEWQLRFVDASEQFGTLPVRLRLTRDDGVIARDQVVNVTREGLRGEWTIPLVPQSDKPVRWHLDMTYLFGSDPIRKSPSDPPGVVVAPAPVVRLDTFRSERRPLPSPVPPEDIAMGAWPSHATRKDPPAAPPIGYRVRDLLIDKSEVLLTLMNWDCNVVRLDLRNGFQRDRRRVGHHFAYAPRIAGGTFVEGFDLLSPEGFHLYVLDPANDQMQQIPRFAAFGLTQRATSWADGKDLADRPGDFALPPNGEWVAASGSLGLAVWWRSGDLRWKDDWSATRRQRMRLIALDNDTLVTLVGMTAVARRAATGAIVWERTLAESGELLGGVAAAPWLVLRATTSGGRVFVLRAGRVEAVLPTEADEVVLSPDGQRIHVLARAALKTYGVDGARQWSFLGDETLRNLRVGPDGRLVCGSELGTLYVLRGGDGRRVLERDVGALPVGAFAPDGSLVVGTWSGRVQKLDRNYAVDWTHSLTLPAVAARWTDELPRDWLAPEPGPTARVTGWGNAAPEPGSLDPRQNLLATTQALFRAMHDPPVHGDPRPWQHSLERLRDGDPRPPDEPWLSWTDVNYIDSGWRPKLVLEADTFRTQVRLTGVTFVEDPQHPESWLRDVRLQWWDAPREQWRDGPYLVTGPRRNEPPQHTHWLPAPLESAKFRLVSPGGGTWPAGNVRLGELVFHGETLGASHPDVVARRPVAVLFDEQESDLKCLMTSGGRPFAFRYDDAFSGGKCLALTSAGETVPEFRTPFGHAVPNWDFEIVEQPGPGQYRWLEFAWKAASPETRGISLRVSESHFGGHTVAVGEAAKFDGATVVSQGSRPPTEWTVVRVDLWSLAKKPFRVRSLSLGSAGGPARFDRLRLLREVNAE